ncbi:MAG: hypothetical protein Q4D98_11935 [Planctomycetia bacterium]|nr:hypothetical protein [Planctomycetia bacterium]
MATVTFREEKIDLKDPYVAAFLAWMLPGLGHFYQGRTGKGILFSVCILSLFIIGVYLGSSETFGVGRDVYFSLRQGDRRFHYFAQVWTGLPASPALLQYLKDPTGQKPLFGGFMAPPLLGTEATQSAYGLSGGSGGQPNAPTVDNIRKRLNRGYELGSFYTMAAGLLNLFAIFDAWMGPVDAEEEKRRKAALKAEKAEKAKNAEKK